MADQRTFTGLLPAAMFEHVPARSVLLDFDGTLVDSQPGIFASCMAALRALGHDPGEALDIKHAIGPPTSSSLPREWLRRNASNSFQL